MFQGGGQPTVATPVAEAADKAAECRGAAKGLRWYVTWTYRWTVRRGVAFSLVVPKAGPCPKYLANIWRGRAVAARKAWQRHWKRVNSHPREIARWLLRNDPGAYECLMYIVSVENAAMDPTLDFGHGHGNVYEAYGIPQANPGTKMASHGPDWRTNPWTQLRWMIDYCRTRYGSVCGAASHRRSVGYY